MGPVPDAIADGDAAGGEPAVEVGAGGPLGNCIREMSAERTGSVSKASGERVSGSEERDMAG